MRSSLSRLLVGAVVKRALKDMKDDPDRGLRNLVDMALQFSGEGFQADFFAQAQAMLQNENSAYYPLMRELIARTDSERLYAFGMDLGFNGCAAGVQRIRENEKKLGCRIPWTLPLQIGTETFAAREAKYQALITSGEKLGIYIWMLFCDRQPESVLPLIGRHPDSAFFLFCAPEDLTSDFLRKAAGVYNLMLAVRYDAGAGALYARLRAQGLLWSLWVPYGQKELEPIVNGDLFSGAQQFFPLFTILLPDRDCPDFIQPLVYQAVQQARGAQSYHTLLWDLWGDNSAAAQIVSGGDSCVYFNADGALCGRKGPASGGPCNMFQNDLQDILVRACPKKGCATA